jgi:CRISPR-associated endonuclease/helicase Cas3
MNYWGRIFFIYKDDRLTRILGQPLDNHTSNSRTILEKFRPSYFHPETRERLMTAVDLHDLGKRDTFRIRYDQDKRKGEKGNKGKNPNTTNRLVYSFAGHRFRVPHDDPYVAGLIRAHHEFSVEQINRERARLLSENDRKNFADDLYLLCMADQIEAELAVKTVEGKENCPRTFMEFTTVRSNVRQNIYTVIPWAFEPSDFTLFFDLKELPLEGDGKENAGSIEKALKSAKDFKQERITINLSEKPDED